MFAATVHLATASSLVGPTEMISLIAKQSCLVSGCRTLQAGLLRPRALAHFTAVLLARFDVCCAACALASWETVAGCANRLSQLVVLQSEPDHRGERIL